VYFNIKKQIESKTMTVEISKLGSDENLDQLGPTHRQKLITEYIHDHGSLEVDDLSEQFQVSRMTIHRDLDELEQQGVLRKVRGGATVHPSYLFESDIRFRLTAAANEKGAIAKYALSLVEPGQVVFLDDSTTTITFAPLIKDVKPNLGHYALVDFENIYEDFHLLTQNRCGLPSQLIYSNYLGYFVLKVCKKIINGTNQRATDETFFCIISIPPEPPPGSR